MNTLRLDGILEVLGGKAVDTLRREGHMKAGHNGPYYDQETPVRNTSHWAVSLSQLYRQTGDERFREGVRLCERYLLSRDARPMSPIFYCRMNPAKDLSNGTIGQAWAIEGLVECYKTTGNRDALQAALDSFLAHPFDERTGIWRIRNVDGSVRGYDPTFNHQLWFAAAGYVILTEIENQDVRRACSHFMQAIGNNVDTHPNGLIRHELLISRGAIDRARKRFNRARTDFRLSMRQNTTKYKEAGYHLFCVYAYALIESCGTCDGFHVNGPVRRAVEFCYSNELIKWLSGASNARDHNRMDAVKNRALNIYGYPYNAPAFEFPLIDRCFGHIVSNKSKERIDELLAPQSRTFDEDTGTFCLENEDPETLAARIYEYTRVIGST